MNISCRIANADTQCGIYLVALQMLILNAGGLQIRPSGQPYSGKDKKSSIHQFINSSNPFSAFQDFKCLISYIIYIL